ncbi:hypothetical protein HN51_023109 [Arachis hypogaea]
MASNAFLKALFYILFVTVLLASEGTMNTVAIQIHTVCFVDGVKQEIIDNVPVSIDRDQWISFVQYRFLPSTMEMCKRNKEVRKKQTIPHAGGSKPSQGKDMK